MTDHFDTDTTPGDFWLDRHFFRLDKTSNFPIERLSMKQIKIVVGVLKRQDKVLISLRQTHQDYANYWEFPGGKVEQGEALEPALIREFLEEVGVETHSWQPLVIIPWQYGHANVELNVFVTEHFKGNPAGCEGQKIRWVSLAELDNYPFPEANEKIKLALGQSF